MIDNASIAMSHGALIASERAEGINDNMCQSHYHNFFELYFLESGERLHMIRDTLYSLKASEFVIFPPHTMHHSYGIENVPFKRILIYFQPEAVASSQILDFFCQDALVCTANSTDRFTIHRLIEMLHDEQRNPSTCSKEYQETILNLLLITIMRKALITPKAEKKNTMSEVIHYIYGHYHEDITIERLSQEFFLSPFYLCRKFKQTTGNTIIQYLNTTRILNAQRMMLETDKRFTEISKETGFSNLTHFNRVFKTVTGMTPSENRRQNKEKRINKTSDSDKKKYPE